jgi:acetolactate decarboxylase
MLSSKTKLSFFSIILIFFFACDNSPKKKQSFEVNYKGALKNIMHKGDLSAKTDLSEFESIENLYALGAIENLKGEIQIFNGEVYNSYVEGKEIKFDSTYSKKATLFVYATVKDWLTLTIPQEIRTEKELEKYLEKIANENNIDTKQAFPFLIQGKASELTWHVIDWKDGDTEHSHEKHISSGLNGTIKNQEVELLGFYSDSHHAIFTHHTTNMHIHLKLNSGKIAGHLDEFKLGTNMTLKLPLIPSSPSVD